MSKNKTVLVYGHFNVIHPGHLRLLRFAKDCGTRLIVAVESDCIAGSAAHVPEHLRLEGVASNCYVDEAFIIDYPVIELIKQLRPDVVVKGKEHETNSNEEAAILASYGTKLLFSSGEAIFSSLDLIRREFTEVFASGIKQPSEFIIRNNINKRNLEHLCQSFKKLKVIIIGDLIVDEYITCQPLGMSQEDPTIVVTPIDSKIFVGGAGIVAAHAAGLGAKVDLVSVTGLDNQRTFCINKLNEFNVKAHLLEDPMRPTTLKQRYRSKGKSLLRVSHLHQDPISLDLQKKMIEIIDSLIAGTHLIVFADFNYGCLPQNLVNQVSNMARSRGIFMAADSQSSSQVGDISRFTGMDLITPTEHEARIATRNHEDGLVVLAEKLRIKSNSKNVMLKMGEEGMLIHSCEKDGKGIKTDQIPALNSHPKDVAGAGDSLIIASAMSMACGANIWEASLIGSFAAGIQVGRLGNTPIQLHQLLLEIK